jgi:hypothetical protein
MRFTVKQLRTHLFVIWDRLTAMPVPYGQYRTQCEAEVVAWLRNRQQA